MDQQQPLVCPSHRTQYIGSVIIGILIGAGATLVYFKQVPADTNNTYQAGYDAAKKRVLESPMGTIFRTPDDIRSVSGTVTSIGGNRITIHTQPMNPFEDQALDNRTVVVTADTKIFKLTQKAPEVFNAEMDAFMKKIQLTKTSSLPATPPSPSTKTAADVASITIGATLNIITVENIKMSEGFSASEIQIQ